MYGFGSTEEFYRLDILGCRRRGRPRDGDFNPDTGRGYIAETPGTYTDALKVKKCKVVPMIIEATGGVAPHSLAQVGHLSRRAKGRGARDSTKYGRSRSSTRNFFVHHIERMGAAAQREDAAAILKQITCRKQQTAYGPDCACGTLSKVGAVRLSGCRAELA